MTNTTDTIRTVLVDDHAIVRAGFRELLKHQTNIEVIGEAESGEQAINLARDLKPQLMIMDINMPGIGGIEAIRQIKKSYPNIHIIALTVYVSAPFPAQVFKAGGQAYLSKQCAPSELINAITAVFSGQTYISKLVKTKIAKVDSSNKINDIDMTPRELQVFELIAQGKNLSEIAEELDLSYKTVHHHRKSMMTKTNLKTNFDIISFSREISSRES